MWVCICVILDLRLWSSSQKKTWFGKLERWTSDCALHMCSSTGHANNIVSATCLGINVCFSHTEIWECLLAEIEEIADICFPCPLDAFLGECRAVYGTVLDVSGGVRLPFCHDMLLGNNYILSGEGTTRPWCRKTLMEQSLVWMSIWILHLPSPFFSPFCFTIPGKEAVIMARWLKGVCLSLAQSRPDNEHDQFLTMHYKKMSLVHKRLVLR